MGRSADAYYAEKLERLLQLQAAQREKKTQLPPPGPSSRIPGRDKPAGSADRAYYEAFRSRMRQTPTSPPHTKKRSASGDGQSKEAPRPRDSRPDSLKRPAVQRRRKDVLLEEKKRVEAYKRAAQGRRKRKAREILLSAVLVFGVFIVLCVVTYQLLFVIRKLDVTGSTRYTAEEVLAASGVDLGDHLYSFSSRVAQEVIMLHCPYVASVDVQRTPPGTIAFSVEEEAAVYYADFYGELWELSPSLRVLDPISETDAKERGLMKLKLPGIQEAISGKKLVFFDGNSEEYLETVLDALGDSELAGRVAMVDLRSPYNISMSCDGKYKLLFGNTDAVETKLRLAAAVLEDTLFESDNKASVDLTDLSATSVIIDNQLDLE